MSGRFSENTREPLVSATQHGLMLAADYALLHSLQAPVLRLSYGPATDHLSGAALTANTYADIHANQNFTVSSTASFLLFTVRLSLIVQSTVAVVSVGTRVVLDSAGTPQNIPLSGGISEVNNYANPGGGTFWLTGLAAGTHTIKTQVVASQTANASCRASSVPNFEFVQIQIVEVSP